MVAFQQSFEFLCFQKYCFQGVDCHGFPQIKFQPYLCKGEFGCQMDRIYSSEEMTAEV